MAVDVFNGRRQKILKTRYRRDSLVSTSRPFSIIYQYHRGHPIWLFKTNDLSPKKKGDFSYVISLPDHSEVTLSTRLYKFITYYFIRLVSRLTTLFTSKSRSLWTEVQKRDDKIHLLFFIETLCSKKYTFILYNQRSTHLYVLGRVKRLDHIILSLMYIGRLKRRTVCRPRAIRNWSRKNGKLHRKL